MCVCGLCVCVFVSVWCAYRVDADGVDGYGGLVLKEGGVVAGVVGLSQLER